MHSASPLFIGIAAKILSCCSALNTEIRVFGSRYPVQCETGALSNAHAAKPSLRISSNMLDVLLSGRPEKHGGL